MAYAATIRVLPKKSDGEFGFSNPKEYIRLPASDTITLFSIIPVATKQKTIKINDIENSSSILTVNFRLQFLNTYNVNKSTKKEARGMLGCKNRNMVKKINKISTAYSVFLYFMYIKKLVRINSDDNNKKEIFPVTNIPLLIIRIVKLVSNKI